LPKVKGSAVLTDTTTEITAKGLDPNSQVTILVSYIDESGQPSFTVSGYATTDDHGAFDFSLAIGKTLVESVTHKNIDHVDVDASTDANSVVVLHSKSD